MSYYRDVYLRSDNWRNKRLDKLISKKCKCAICGVQSVSNDVHHLRYGKLFDISKEDLAVLCRICHNNVHKLMERFRGMKRLPSKHQMKVIKDHLLKEARLYRQKRNNKRAYSRKLFSGQQLFGKLRKELTHKRVVGRRHMPWVNGLFSRGEAKRLRSMSSEELLEFYVKRTGHNPLSIVIRPSWEIVKYLPTKVA